MSGQWSFAIDRGGTFTDVVATSADGQQRVLKLLSEQPGRYDDAALEAVRSVLLAEGGTIASVRIGTTVATNALLERNGAQTALLTTQGFADVLRIGTQARPEIFARHIILPDMLAASVSEVTERVAADGTVLKALNEVAARHALACLHADGFESLAIILMHGWNYPTHERRLAELAREAGFTQVSASHEVAPLIKFVSRGDTTVADAYLSPILRGYVDQVAAGLPRTADLSFMQSNGGLAAAQAVRGKDAVLSGPAGGVVGMVAAGMTHGEELLIGFDMGGTSTDVSHYAGQLELAEESIVAGVRIRAPMMQIHTVAAGGGSICRFDGMRFRVGPESAGAQPGPACYRNGGPLTVTDCHLVLGRLVPTLFPSVFGPGGDQPLEAAAAQARITEVAEAIQAVTGNSLDTTEIAEGFLEIANENMAAAIRKISVARGHDVSRYALCCFGGAGGQHACRVAERLGMERILIHPLAGVLSAYGIGLAELKVLKERSWRQPLGVDHAPALEALKAEVYQTLIAQGVDPGLAKISSRVRLRLEASDTSIELTLDEPATMLEAFHAEHRRRFGYTDEQAIVIVEALIAEAVGGTTDNQSGKDEPGLGALPFQNDHWRCFKRAELGASQCIVGPALILDASSTTVVEEGWAAERLFDGTLLLTHQTPGKTQQKAGTQLDPVRLEIFNNLFMSIAEEMGVALQATATSVNIKERLDFSCAIFDSGGALIANAPHIPVHLGSMGESIRTIIDRRGAGRDGRGIRRGDAYVLNDPYRGGTHLPDITVIMPVFLDEGDAPAAFVAARGHHADVGGIAPGSMPPESRSIEEEGVLIDNELLVDEGRLRELEMRMIFAEGQWPARRPDRNMADLKAQLAACSRGSDMLRKVAGENGCDVVVAYMGHVLANAEESVRRMLANLENGSFSYELDNGAIVEVAIRVAQAARSAVFDFTGTSQQRLDNFNAPRAIARAAALYVVRTLMDADMPLNDGCLRPVQIILPERSMLSPEFPAAVVAGNVETSQVITDALFAATGRLAPSQGTMNNFTFGNQSHQYYETIAGGSGAGPDHDGTDAVQTHMTNSRLTDPEILETRLPVRLDRFAIRRGSGGRGKYHGGDGVIREITFLEPMRANILANRRRVPPAGLAGGEAALPGRNWVERADGSVEDLTGTAHAEMQPGDRFIIETPGGGGFGRPE